MRESDLWSQFKTQLANYQLAPTWARRFETRLQSGIADVSLRVGYVTGHIELKISKIKTGTNALRPGLRPDQKNWLQNFRGPSVFGGEHVRRPPAGVMVAVPYINRSLLYVPAREEAHDWWSEERSFADWIQEGLKVRGIMLFSYDNPAGWKAFFHHWHTDVSLPTIRRIEANVV